MCTQLTLSCNIVLISREEPSTFSLYFGQDHSFSPNRIELDRIYKIDALSDVDKVPVGLELTDFQATLDQVFEESNARAHELVNVIYIVKKLLDRDDLDRDGDYKPRKSSGRRRSGRLFRIF